MKTLSVFHPFEMDKPTLDVERFVNSFFGDGLKAMGQSLARGPAADVIETKNAYVLEMELPGLEQKDIEVNVDHNSLTVASVLDKENKKQDTEEQQYVIRERRCGSFSRSFRLPDDADTEAIDANFKNGLLRLEIKKRAEAQKRLIRIGN